MRSDKSVRGDEATLSVIEFSLQECVKEQEIQATFTTCDALVQTAGDEVNTIIKTKEQ